MSPTLINPYILASEAPPAGPILGWNKLAQSSVYPNTVTVGTSWNPFASEPISAGNHQIIRVEIVTDNFSSATTPNFTLSKPGGETNSWKEVVKKAQATTGGNTTRLSTFAIMTTMEWEDHNLQITLDQSMTNAVANWQVWEGGSLLNRISPLIYPLNQLNTTITMYAMLGDCLWGVVAGDTTAISAKDSDTVNGSWEDSGAAAGGASGLTSTHVQMRSQYKIPTAGGSQTFNIEGAVGDTAILASMVPAGGMTCVWDAVTGGFSGTYPIFTLSDANTPLEIGDLMVGIGLFKQYNAVVPNPTGWTPGASGVSGSTTAVGNDTGSVLSKGYHKLSDGLEASFTLEPTSGSFNGFGRVGRFRIGDQSYAKKAFDVASYELVDSDSTGTTVIAVASTTPDIVAGDILFVSVGLRTDATLSAEAMSVPGCTGTFVPLAQASTTVNADIRVAAGLFYVETGTCTSAPSWTGTISSAGFSEGAGVLYRIRTTTGVAFTVVQEGGNIDGPTARPKFTFETGTRPMVANDLILAASCWKGIGAGPDAAGHIPSDPSGYTLEAGPSYSGSVNSNGNPGQGSVAIKQYSRVADGSEGADVVTTSTNYGIGMGKVIRLRASTPCTWDVDAVSGADTTLAGTTLDITGGSTLACAAGDKVFFKLFLPEQNTSPTSIALSIPGCTLSAITELTITNFTTDPDGRMHCGFVTVLSGTASGAPNLTAQYSSGNSHAVASFTRVRATAV